VPVSTTRSRSMFGSAFPGQLGCASGSGSEAGSAAGAASAGEFVAFAAGSPTGETTAPPGGAVTTPNVTAGRFEEFLGALAS
jgi:hypothetical protein